MHRGSFRMQLCLHLHAIMFTLVAACLTASTNSVIASRLEVSLAPSVLSPNQKFLALQIWRHLLELQFEKQKFTFTLQVWLHVVPLQSKWHVSAYIALRYSSSYMRKLPRTIFKVFKAKCLLSSLPGRCNLFARELSRPKKIMPWLRETISKVIFWAEYIRMSSIKEFVRQKITQEIHALQTDQSAFNTFSVLLRSMSRWLKKLNKCASNLGQTWKRSTEKKLKLNRLLAAFSDGLSY